MNKKVIYYVAKSQVPGTLFSKGSHISTEVYNKLLNSQKVYFQESIIEGDAAIVDRIVSLYPYATEAVLEVRATPEENNLESSNKKKKTKK